MTHEPPHPTESRAPERRGRTAYQFESHSDALAVQLNLAFNQQDVHSEALTGSPEDLPQLLQQISDTVIQHCPVQ